MLQAYDVGIREVHVNTIRVLAETPEEAKERAEAEAQCGVMNLEYSHTMDKEHWSTEAIERKVADAADPE